jgi:hypothetical protein
LSQKAQKHSLEQLQARFDKQKFDFEEIIQVKISNSKEEIYSLCLKMQKAIESIQN